MAEFGLFTCDSMCQWGCVPLVGFVACRSDYVRVWCDRGMQERLCEGAVRPRQLSTSVTPFHYGNFRQAWQKCVVKYGNARPRPKQDTSTYIGVLVLKNKGGVFLRGIHRYKYSFDVSINAYFFSPQRANHLTPHRLINAAPCKPTFSLPHACKGILMSLVASTRQTPSILPRLVLVAFFKL